MGLFGMRAKAGFKHIPLTAHKYGLIPLAEFTKVVGVPGSDADEEDEPPHANKLAVTTDTKPIKTKRFLVTKLLIADPYQYECLVYNLKGG
jgi:hypothetical protein